MDRRARPRPGREKGFTLVRLVLALAGLLFASLVVPSWLAIRVNQSRIARAEHEVAVIAEAIRRFEVDNGFLPLWDRARAGGPGEETDRIDLLVGSGEMPEVAESAGSVWLSGRSDSLADQLTFNVPGYASGPSGGRRGWAGPYVSPDHPDPWGNCYLVAALGGGALGLRVVSAGPNGVLETNPEWVSGPDERPGDDVVVQIWPRDVTGGLQPTSSGGFLSRQRVVARAIG